MAHNAPTSQPANGGNREHLGDIVAALGGIEMTAEVWPHGSIGDEDTDRATVVDVVRIDDRLHFVVVLDG